MAEWRITVASRALMVTVLTLALLEVALAQTAQNSTTLRLVGGSTNYGRLEIQYNGVWGTICDDEFDTNDARVACRQLGLDTGTVRYYTNARYGLGSGIIWLDDLACTGLESSLATCSHRGFGIEDCTHSEDVGISCGVAVAPPTSSSGVVNIGWTGIVIVFIVFAVSCSVYRRRRLYMQQQQRQTTTIIQPPSTTVVGLSPATQGNAPLPTYYHGAQPPSSSTAYGTGAQPYPPVNAGGYAYPPPAPSGLQDTAPNSQPYPVQPYAYPSVPAQSGNVPPGSAYPPLQADGFQSPPMYAAYGSPSVPPMGPTPPAQEQNLPPPPMYDDVVKQ